MKKYLFMSVIFGALAVSGQQNVKFEQENFANNVDEYQKAVNALDSGEVYYRMGPTRYCLAIPYFLTAEKFNPNNDQLNYLIGLCMLGEHSPDKTAALPYLQKALQLNPAVADDIHYQIGRAYHLNMDWENAKQEYNTYLQSLNQNRFAAQAADTKKKIEECNNGEELVKNPVNTTIVNVGQSINSQYPEYGALVSADESEMIFTSRRPSEGDKIAKVDGLFDENIYMSLFQDGAWSPAKKLGSTVNVSGNDAVAGISADGQTLYIYHGANGGDIYESHLKGSSWSSAERLSSKINTNHEKSVSLGPDGKTLYFVSDRPGGLGGNDIYVSVADANGNWGDAVNLGPVVNTKYDDEAVSIQADGKTLYFSSQGHNTMGGFDIFKTTRTDSGKWTAPVNLGYPINTPDDDIFFCVSASGKHAYISSIRKDGYGEKDIYMITISPQTPPVAKLTLLTGIVTDSMTHKPLEASIEIVDNQKNSVIATFKSNSATGKYLVSLPVGVNYGIAVKADGYLFYSANIDLSDTSNYYKEIVKNIALQPLTKGSSIVLNNIFFDFNKYTLRPESKTELDRIVGLLKDHPALKIEISGYCDSVGTVPYNLTLSLNRSKAVVAYLEKQGVSSKRLTYKGYGKSHYAATNKTDAGRQLNRRTEFKITAGE